MDFPIITAQQLLSDAVVFAVRDLHALEPDDEPDPAFDVSMTFEGKLYYSDDVYETSEECDMVIVWAKRRGVGISDDHSMDSAFSVLSPEDSALNNAGLPESA